MKNNTIYLFFYGSFILLCVSYIYNHPAYNWDILPYMALILENDIDSNEDVHSQTYSFAENNFKTDVYLELIDENKGFRTRSLNEFNFFHNNLDLYRVKPLYNSAVLLIHKLGVPLDRATIVPGLVAFVGIGYILFLWLSCYLPTATSIVFCISLLAFLIPTIRLSTPDSMSCFFIIASAYLFKNKHDILALLFLILTVFTRIDNAVFASLFGLFILYKGEFNKIILLFYQLAIVALVALIYLYLPEEGGMLGKSTHFDSLTTYFWTIAKNSYGLFLLTPFGIIILVLLLVLRKVKVKVDFSLIWIISLTIIIRMLILPVHHTRFYIAYEILLLLIVLNSYRSQINKIVRNYVS